MIDIIRKLSDPKTQQAMMGQAQELVATLKHIEKHVCDCIPESPENQK